MSKLPPTPRLPERYQLWPSPDKALLGQGGASTVWRARDQVLGVLVALKVLRSEGARIQARLEREAALAARVMHPNVVALHDMGRTPGGKPYVAFALASDGSMLDLAARPPAWPELLDMLLGALRALAALHSRGLLHLDVKLSNLLLHRTHPQRRTVWLADLGVARAVYGGEDDDDHAVVGTVSYMPSERLTGQHHLWSPSADLFSIGVVIYRLLSGTLPYPPNDPVEALAARKRVPRTIPIRNGYRAPAGIDEAVLPMLEPDFRARYDLCADAIRALESLPSVNGTPPLDPAGLPDRPPAMGVPIWHRPRPRVLPDHLDRAMPPRRIPQAPSLLVHREIPLVGRQPEYEALWQAARDAVERRRPVLVELSGERGSGRTRLVQEFTRAVEEAGLGEGVLMEYAVRKGPGLGLRGAWRRIAPPCTSSAFHERLLAGTLARDRNVALVAAQPDAHALAQWMAPKAEASQTDRSLVRTLLGEHLEYRSWRGLSWLWLEDAHLADATDDCWALVDMLFARRAPVLILVTTRSGQVTPSLLELAARHHASMRRIELAPLDEQAAHDLVHTYLPLDPELSRRLALHTGGNPSYMRDILLHWIRTGMLEQTGEDPHHGSTWSLRAEAPPMPADRHAFARERIGSALAADPTRLRTLLALALAGPGASEVVMARVVDDALDALVVEGLVGLQGGRPVLEPPEAAEIIHGWPRDAAIDVELHARLADAWEVEGDEPRVAAQVGRHRALAGQVEPALGPLDIALRYLRWSLPVGEVVAMARQTREVAQQVARLPEAADTEPARDAWANATLTLADSLWNAGEAQVPRELDEELRTYEHGSEVAVLAACSAAGRLCADRDHSAAIERLASIVDRLPHVSPAARAEFYTVRAWVRQRGLDNDGALADVLDALSNRPSPDTEARARLLRVRMMSLVNPVVAWHEAMQTVEFARDRGLLRHELLAWGVVADEMIALEHTDEVLQRLGAGADRLRAHGDLRGAAEMQLYLGWALRSAGRETEAEEVFRRNLGALSPRVGLDPWGARLGLAVCAANRRDGRSILALYESKRRDPAAMCAWALLLPITRMLVGLEARIPDRETVFQAPHLGLHGVFLALAVSMLFEERGNRREAETVRAWLELTCRSYGIEESVAEFFVARFAAARR